MRVPWLGELPRRERPRTVLLEELVGDADRDGDGVGFSIGGMGRRMAMCIRRSWSCERLSNGNHRIQINAFAVCTLRWPCL